MINQETSLNEKEFEQTKRKSHIEGTELQNILLKLIKENQPISGYDLVKKLLRIDDKHELANVRSGDFNCMNVRVSNALKQLFEKKLVTFNLENSQGLIKKKMWSVI